MNVEDRHIGQVLLDQVLSHLAIIGFGDDLDIPGVFQELANTGAHDSVVIRQEHPDFWVGTSSVFSQWRIGGPAEGLVQVREAKPDQPEAKEEARQQAHQGVKRPPGIAGVEGWS